MSAGAQLFIHLCRGYLLSASCAQNSVKYVTGYRVDYDTMAGVLKDHTGRVAGDGTQGGVDKGPRAGQAIAVFQREMPT